MKLVNFASFDPTHQARGVSGLKGASHADRAIWDEFHSDWERLAFESEVRQHELLPSTPREDHLSDTSTMRNFEFPLSIPDGPTESSGILKIRTVQGFFRKAVLAAYGGRCCVTGNPVPELLIASHILPWSRFPEHRVNPSNGLCLAAHFDKAFDHGLISFDSSLRLMLSGHLKTYLPNDALAREFVPLEGIQLRLPEKFSPNMDFIKTHRENTFIK